MICDRWRSHLPLKKAHEGHPPVFFRLRRAPRPPRDARRRTAGLSRPHGARDGPSVGHGTLFRGCGGNAITSERRGRDLAFAYPWRPPSPISSVCGALRVASTLRLRAGFGWIGTRVVVGEARGGRSAPSWSICAHGGCSRSHSFASCGRACGGLLAGTADLISRAPSERAVRSAACFLLLGVYGRTCEGRESA